MPEVTVCEKCGRDLERDEECPNCAVNDFLDSCKPWDGQPRDCEGCQ